MGVESDRVLRELNKFIEKEVGRLQLRAFQAVTTATPVDTGFARGSWSPSVGSPNTSAANPPSDQSAAAAEGSIRLTKNRTLAQSLAVSYKLTRGPIFISNNAPYIGKLNGGSSAQAPSRFVEAAILQAVRGS